MKVVVICKTNGAFSGGTSKYLNRVIPLLREQPAMDEVHVYVPEQAFSGMDSAVEARAWGPGSGLRDAMAAIRTAKPDVIYVPTARAVTTGKIPLVVMVRNMEPLVAPFRRNSVQDCVKNTARRAAARNACVRAHRIIAVSGAVRGFLTEKWHVEDARIGVVHHGAEEPMPPERATRPVSAPYVPFLFTAGSIRPYRGLEDAIEAVAALQSMGQKTHLFVAGEAHPTSEGYANRLRRLASEMGVAGSVHWLGQIGRAEMAWCYLQCEAFVTTSRVEACPNTVLEALAYGCAIVSTDSAPMPELIGKAARYYPAGHQHLLAQSIVQLTRTVQQDLRVAARDRARIFDWRTTARLTARQITLAVRHPTPAGESLEQNSAET